MPATIAAYCREIRTAGARKRPGHFTRCIFESLALLYGAMLDTLRAAHQSHDQKFTLSVAGAKAAC